MLGVRLDKDLEKKIAQYAKKMRKNKSTFVKKVISDYLKKKETEEWHHAQTLKGWSEVETGEGLPGEKVFAYLKSWGPDT